MSQQLLIRALDAPVGSRERTGAAGLAVLTSLAQSALVIGALVFAGIAVICWLYRARTNLTAFGGQPLTWGRGWTIGGWFIPIANLFIPISVIAEIDAKSEAAADAIAGAPATRTHRRLLFALWAATWTLYLIVDRVDSAITVATSGSTSTSSDVTDMRPVSIGIAMLSAGLGIAAAAFMTILIRRVTANQDRTLAAAAQAYYQQQYAPYPTL
jgi:hypothetical protein